MIYEYQCVMCGNTTEGIRRMKDRDNCPTCDACGILMQRTILTPPAFKAPIWNIDPYKCIATGETITSMKQRARIMEENDLVDAREFGEPDFDKMGEDREEFHKKAKQEIPPDLEEAMTREGHADLL
jgi:putative FmdB family regulatory protein